MSNRPRRGIVSGADVREFPTTREIVREYPLHEAVVFDLTRRQGASQFRRRPPAALCGRR